MGPESLVSPFEADVLEQQSPAFLAPGTGFRGRTVFPWNNVGVEETGGGAQAVMQTASTDGEAGG